MKIKISDLENNIGYKIKRNFKSIGLDTAQISGIAFLTTDEEYLHVETMVLSFKTTNHKEIYETMVRTFERFFKNENIAIIESVFVGFSRAGSVELARYGSFAIAECIKKDIPYEIISAVSARSKFNIDTKSAGKGRTKEAVKRWTDSVGFNFDDNNIVDAVVLGILGICQDMDFRSKVAIQKSLSRPTVKRVTKKKVNKVTKKRTRKNVSIKK